MTACIASCRQPGRRLHPHLHGAPQRMRHRRGLRWGQLDREERWRCNYIGRGVTRRTVRAGSLGVLVVGVVAGVCREHQGEGVGELVVGLGVGASGARTRGRVGCGVAIQHLPIKSQRPVASVGEDGGNDGGGGGEGKG